MRPRTHGLVFVAVGVAAVGFAAAQALVEASQAPVVVTRFLLGYHDSAGRFVPTAGRGATNVDRDATAMFLFSGPIDMGPNLRATLPLTLAEQVELEARQAADPEYDPERDGYEPGVIPRKASTDRAAYFVATGSVSPASVLIGVPQPDGNFVRAPGQFFKALKNRSKPTAIKNRLLFNPRYVPSSSFHPSWIDLNPRGLEAETQYTVLIDRGSKAQNPFNLLRNLNGAPVAVRFSTTFTTSNRYAQDFSRPLVLGVSPADGTIDVQQDAHIEITFSEAMDVSSFDPPRVEGDTQWTIAVRHTLNPINGLLAGTDLLVSPSVKPQTGGEVIQITPIHGFGESPSEIECIVRTGVRDLSGNRLIRQVELTFKTVSDPAAESAGPADE